MPNRAWPRRLHRAVVRARLGQRHRPRTTGQRLVSLAALVLAGFMMTTAALAARGEELRPSRNTELVQLVRDQASRNQQLAAEVARTRAEVDQLAQQKAPAAQGEPQAAEQAHLTPVRGPAVSVSLQDAPVNVKPAGVSESLLIVHQQDIQAVVNAMWAGGAEAMTIQGQRVSSRTGIKCVGNTVLLHGIPYAPPYVIVAIGDQGRLEESLAQSSYLRAYRQAAERYGLGYTQRRVGEVRMDGYQGAVDLQQARKPG
ncbi:MAG: DUF881 domain-containing protein [Actinomycetia bacterium]|nr:DUF881 domain-containing protein [Actinomycetes bacterium]